MKKLFSRIRLWFRAKSSPRIFCYSDGSQWRSIDPLEVIRVFEEHPTYNDSRHFKDSYSTDADTRNEAIAEMAQVAIDAFGVTAYDGKTRTGLTIMERVALVRAFAHYCEYVKKNIETSRTSQPSTGAT